MSSAAMKWAIGQCVEHAALRHTLDVLATLADERGMLWHSQGAIAERLSMSERSVRRSLAALERLGVIQRTLRSNGRGGRSSNLIRLALDRDFTFTRKALKGLFQPANVSGKSRSSNRTNLTLQPANLSGD